MKICSPIRAIWIIKVFVSAFGKYHPVNMRTRDIKSFSRKKLFLKIICPLTLQCPRIFITHTKYDFRYFHGAGEKKTPLNELWWVKKPTSSKFFGGIQKITWSLEPNKIHTVKPPKTGGKHEKKCQMITEMYSLQCHLVCLPRVIPAVKKILKIQS